MCPYYLLTSYQSDDKSGYIYGGYPAFACPSKTYLYISQCLANIEMGLFETVLVKYYDLV